MSSVKPAIDISKTARFSRRSAGDARFSSKARAEAEAEDASICVSAVTAWEVTNKVRIGKWPEAAMLAGLVKSPSRLAIAPSSPQVLYAEDGGRIMRSADGGATWSQQSTWTETFDVFTVDPRDPNTVYVSTSDSLYRSRDAAVH